VPARLLPQRATCGQRIGKTDGGGVLCQSVLTRPDVVSWNAISPCACGAVSGLPSSAVFHSSRNALSFCSLTVSFSFVGVVLYELSVHSYVHVASAACGNHDASA
jgi:hypothetical protein